jgi:hypothetical protein
MKHREINDLMNQSIFPDAYKLKRMLHELFLAEAQLYFVTNKIV